MSKPKTSAKFFTSSAVVTVTSRIKKTANFVYHKLKKYVFTPINKPVILTLIVIALFSDLFLISANSDLQFFGITGIFAISAFFYRLPSRYTFVLCLVLLIFMYISFLISDASAFTEKASVWIVLFMAVGIIQQWNE